MYKQMAKFFNDKFTTQEEEFIQKIIKSFNGFKNSAFFQSQILETESQNDGKVGKLIESTIKHEFFKQNSDYDKNLSSNSLLKEFYPKTDLQYHNNNLQIKTATFNPFIKNILIELIKEKFDLDQKSKTKIKLSKSNLKEYKSYFKKFTTLTLFFIYEIDKKNNFFNFKFFFFNKIEINVYFF